MAHTTINHPLFPLGIRGYLLLIVCMALFITPTMAATTQVHVVKYASDGTTVLAEQTLTYQQMRDTMTVLGDGTTHYYHQGPVFIDDPDEATEQALRWNPDEDTNVEEKDMGAAMGTNIRELCDLVGGMSPGDTLRIKASDGMTKDFAYENVYGYSSREGPMVLTWYTDFNTADSNPGVYPDTGYTDGMRLVWFADDSVNPWGIHAFGNYDWHEAAAPEYWYYYIQGGENYPTTTGLSVKYVSEIRIISSAGPVAPVAAFTSDKQSGTAPLTVQFTDQSTNSPTSWAWDFGDSATSTGQSPSHTYTTEGTFTVSLTATNAGGGDTETKTGYITVSATPVTTVAEFTSDIQSGDAPLTVQFTDQSTNSPTSWAWDFGDSATSTGQSPSHTYTTEGTFTVSLTATNAGGSDTETKTGYITVSPASVIPPVAAFTSSVQSGTAPLTVQFTDQSTNSPTSWAWDFNNDGTVDSTTQSPSYTYDTAGTYTVNLTVMNAVGIDSEVKTDYITVQSSGGSTTVIIPTDGDTTITQRSTGASDDGVETMLVRTWATRNQNLRSAVHFDLSSIPSGTTITSATLHLYIADIAGGDGVTVYQNDIHRITGGDWYAPILTWSNCPAFEPVPTDSQPTGTVKDVWMVWDVTPDMEAYAAGAPMFGWIIKYPVENSPTNTIVSYNTLECVDPARRPYLEVTYTADGPVSPVAAFFADTTGGNAPLTVHFMDESSGSPTSWAWDFGDGTTGTEQSPSHTYTNEGTFAVSLTAKNAGGSNTETKTGYITVTPAPVAPAAHFTAQATTGTAPLEVQFIDSSEGTSPLTYAWDFTNDGTVDSTEQFPVWIYNDPGTYTVSLTVTNAVGSDTEIKTGLITVTSPYPTILWGPYLTSTTTTGTVVNVKTDMATVVTVEYATDTYFTANAAYDQSATDGATDMLHHVSLSGLAPDTLYHYRVTYDGQQTSDFHFRTFSESGPITFIVYSDTQDQLPTFSQLERHKLVADRIAEEENVAFVLNSGDLVNNAANLDDWDRYFTAGSMMMANTTVYPALGNHDANDPNYYAAYGVPEYYSFDCADIHVSVLDSNDWAWPDLPTQSTWLATDLQTDKPFRFASFHHPLYTSDSKHFGGWENLRQEWEDDFNENGVLAVFNGHVHAYERILVNDTNYFVAGIGGAPSYNLATPRYEGSQNSLEYMIGYTRVTVDPAAHTATAEVIRVADVSTDLKTLTTIYPEDTVFETVIMTIAEPPGANFTAEPDAGLMPLTVQFTDTTSGTAPFTYIWDFGDGTTSAEQSPSHTYSAYGTYTVSLTATNSAGTDTETKDSFIVVNQPPPDAIFTADPVSGTVPLTVQFTDSSLNAEAWVWDFGDGTTGMEQSPSHIYTNAGTYSVNLTVTNTAGSSTQFTTITVLPPLPVAGFAATPLSGTAPLTVQFTDTSSDAASWSWNFGDGASSAEQSPSHTYTSAGTYTVELTVTNAAGSASSQHQISVTTAPPVAGFAANVTSGTVPLTVKFTDASTGSPTSWAWNFGDGTTSTLQDPVHKFTTAGTYTVTLTATNAGGSSSKSMTIAVNPKKPVARFDQNKYSGKIPMTVKFTDRSTNNPTSYLWRFGDGSTSMEKSPSHTYTQAGIYIIRLTATNGGGSDSATSLVVALPRWWFW